MEFISLFASPSSKSQCNFEAISIVYDSPDVADVGGQQLRVVFIDGFGCGYIQILLAHVEVEGCMRTFTFTPFLELPHQPTESNGHYTDDNRSQAEDDVNSIIR